MMPAPASTVRRRADRGCPTIVAVSDGPVHLTSAQLRQRLGRFVVRTIDPGGRRRAAVAVAVTEAGFGAEVQGTPTHTMER